MQAVELAKGIEALAHANALQGPLVISDLRPMQGGASSEIWTFDASWFDNGQDTSHPLILRSGMAQEFAFSGRGSEFRMLRALEGSGVPAPRVLWLDEDGQFLGRPSMVMERSSGVADRALLTPANRFGLDATSRAALGAEFIDILARLHSVVPSRMQPADRDPEPYSAARQLQAHDEAIARLEAEPMLELRLASWWLWRHLPAPPARTVIVHGDYRPANVLIDGGRISALLDWEFAHAGDPAEDLGWYLSPHYTVEHTVPGHWEAEDVLRHYEARTATTVDRAAVQFWGVFAMYKLAYMTVGALRWQCDGDASRMAASARPILQSLLKAIVTPVTPQVSL